jgi:hypothetical protein
MKRLLVGVLVLGMMVIAGIAFGGEKTRDGLFIAYDNGTVLDTRTNLMWAANDNGSDISWADAKSYCENYRGGGYSDWRMPTRDELAGLYDSAKTNITANGFPARLTELIWLSAPVVWASDTHGSDAAFFGFSLGEGAWSPQSYTFYRALPVRFSK